MSSVSIWSQAVEMCKSQAARHRNLAKVLKHDIKDQPNTEVENRIKQHINEAEEWEKWLSELTHSEYELPLQLRESFTPEQLQKRMGAARE